MNYQIIKADLPKKKSYDRRLKPNSPKKLAAASGLIHFQGRPCIRNHSGLRYTKGGQCVECIGLARGNPINPRGRSTSNHENSLKAASEGKTTYEPAAPCKFGHLLRYVNSNNCVQCDKDTLAKHKINAKFARIKKLYSLEKNQYLDLVKSQNSSCKLCKKFEFNYFKLYIDHCHDTNKVRGLLCNKCNQGIGLLNHNAELLREAAVYCEET